MPTSSFFYAWNRSYRVIMRNESLPGQASSFKKGQILSQIEDSKDFLEMTLIAIGNSPCKRIHIESSKEDIKKNSSPISTDLLEQPGTRVGPVAFGGAFGHVEDFGGLDVGEAYEESEFDEFGALGIFLLEFGEGFIDQ